MTPARPVKINCENFVQKFRLLSTGVENEVTGGKELRLETEKESKRPIFTSPSSS